MKLVFISDTHTFHNKVDVPSGDVLIHSGDATGRGTAREIYEFGLWFGSFPHKHKIFVAGNHDLMFERDRTLAQNILSPDNSIIYLQDSVVKIGDLRFYGSPWQPRFGDWAFNLDRGAAIKKKWDLIPSGLDVLITHGPSMGILDQITPDGEHLGCEELILAVKNVKPKIHAFGHIHGGAGVAHSLDTLFVNAAICNERYEPVNSAFVMNL